ncbi:amidase [Conexibacter sp. CPCC 206217]|uniref:amidase n=1 Tax=Conexibacter sp. CPCC 206217 TaxID=3064574 RepID=UPI002723A745|nr:amidase family protein [Conexibacter sp. CPCC 206217]MDO8211779.1 amidase family protein [Conexibacter sp. CPCC 206217]
MRSPRSQRQRRRALGVAAVLAAGAGAILAPTAGAVNYVTSANGERWEVNDAAMPGLDTGSIRSTTGSSLLGYGGIRVSVSGAERARMDGELLRGFGLRYDGLDRFTTTTPVNLSGIDIARDVDFDLPGNTARFVDRFTNRTSMPVTVEVTFGGILGQNNGENQSEVVNSGSGDTTISSADSWVEVATPTAAATTPTSGPSQNGPSATVLGTAGTGLLGSLLRPANFFRNPFANPLEVGTGMEANFFGFLRRMTLQPGDTRALANFVVIGRRETGSGAPAAGTEIEAVRVAAAALAASPDFDDLSTGRLCELANWDLAGIDPALPATCATRQLPQPEAARPAREPVTSSPYDVKGKTLTQLQADMEASVTTSQEIVRAYLDRIAAYDTGQLGLHSFIHVADDAMEQARAADVARANGRTGALLGIPVAVKDLYDTKDMPTTNGSLVFEGFRPTKDAFQVARLRAAGAVILGKANMSEFANSGRHSESPWGQVWNAIKPSSTAQGSSGGSGVAVAASFAAFAMGSQTGVSLNAPSGASSLVALRGTDGMSSVTGAMPLTWMQDYAGPLARSVTDLATILNVTTGTDPHDEATVDADRYRPADWTSVLDADALRGKRIGYLPDTFATTSYGTPGTLVVSNAALQEIRAMGAELVPMPRAPGTTSSSAGGNLGAEGWYRWIADHPESPYRTPAQIQTSPLKLPYNRSTTYTGVPMSAEQVTAARAARTGSKARLAAWMDAENVEAVVYPNNTSDFHDNDSGALGGAFATAPASSFGAPEVIVPVGINDHGFPVSLQIQGRAWDDARIVGFAYAIEQRMHGHVEPPKLPPLRYVPGSEPVPIVIDKADPPVTEPESPAPPTNGGPPAEGGTPPLPPAPAPAPPTTPGVRKPVVKKSVSLRTSSTAIRNGRAVTVRVTIVAPKALAGKTVAIQRKLGRRIVTIARVKVGKSGRVVATLRLKPAASYRLRTTVAATATTKPATSAFKLVKVRAAKR